MVSAERIESYRKKGREVQLAQTGDEDLGPLKLLPGTWKNSGGFAARGWNMIALPFAADDNPFAYRLLMNHYEEELKFSLVDKAVPNRGIDRAAGTNTDQFVVTLDFEQMIKQIDAEDQPDSGLAGPADLPIHHEPGLWLHMTNERTDDLDIARLSTVPHGDSILALGRSEVIDGPPEIEAINGLPTGVTHDLDNNPYLAPYKHYSDNPFKGTITAAGFPGFNPVSPHELLTLGLPPNVARTTVLEVNTTVNSGGIKNLPFIVKQANAVEMVSTFYVMEVENGDDDAKLVMAYSQVVILDFFPRRDGHPGLIGWPHVSINTMEKVDEPSYEKASMPSA
ncbi:MAG: heme-binding protein [Roseovarius sp.]|jgi:hypothetical protein|uniref:heme-binding protein n=1 Tax=Roseovarius sp. TaxID=1486281 RepID=UPI0032EE0BE0